MALKIVFMGAPDFARTILQALIDSNHDVVCVYSQPPRPAGRGKQERPTPVHLLAEAQGILVRTPVSLKDSAEQAAFAALKADVAVVAAYGLILPKPILDAPRKGCVNVHASLLPRWRGAAPIQRAIMEGDTESGVTIMGMEEGLDTGPMLLMSGVDIGPETTAGELHDALADLGARLLLDALDRLEVGLLKPRPQPLAGVTYAAKIDKAEARLDWTRPAGEVARRINGLSPFPGAWFEAGGQRVKALKAMVDADEGAPGLVTDDESLTIACGRGSVRLFLVQREGKGPMSAEEFRRGFALPRGTVLI